MEALPVPTSAHDGWNDALSQSLDQQRGRVREFLAGQRQRWQRSETQLLARIEELKNELARHQARSEEFRARQEELQGRQTALAEAEARLGEERLALQSQRSRQEVESEQLAALRQELEEARARLAVENQDLAVRQAEAESRGRMLARELRRRHAKQLKEIAQQRAELARQAARPPSALEEELQTARYCERQLAAELEAAARRESELTAIAESLRATCDELRQELANRSASSAAGETADEDLHRRHEMALDDLRELKARNAELQKQLAQASATRPAGVKASDGTLNWEEQKRRMLAALESDFEAENPATAAERLKIEEVIRATDAALAEKDCENTQLRQRLLEAQNSDHVAAAAVGKVLDEDAVIGREREKLRQLQEQWREKLRQAEVDLSMERAKLARQQAQVEEKVRALEAGRDEAAAAGGSRSGKPVRGRWLARLGLKDKDGEK